MRLIGITGTIGAGKGTAAAYLAGRGFRHYSAREFIAAEIRRRGLPADRGTMQQVANDLRATHGAGYIAASLCGEALRSGADAVIESIRTVAGVRAVHACGGKVLAVDADPRTRYARILARGTETDHVSFEEFMADEAREMMNAAEHEQNLAACIALADMRIVNDGTPEEFYARIDQWLSEGEGPYNERQ